MSAIHIRAAEFSDLMTPQGIRAGADSGEPMVSATSRSFESGSVGVWESEPGGWPVIDRPNTEVCVITSGAGVVTDTVTGESYQLSAGDVLVLPKSWTGRWDVSETLRKVFVTF